MTLFEIATLGCKVNQYESARIATILRDNGWEAAGEDQADLVIINTCLVTNIAERKSRQLIRKLQKKNPDARMIILGCYSNLKKDELKKYFPEAQIILQNDKTDLLSWDIDILSNIQQNKDLPALTSSRFRQILKIQDGCDQFCSYCIIPHARGTLYSRSKKDILSEAGRLIKDDIKELVLTGINLGKYKDQNNSLSDILKGISDLGFSRIRLSSIEPNLITDELIELIINRNNIMPHLHIPLQSGSNQILKLMNRPYSAKYYQDLVKKLKKSSINITTDLIVGFPGETEQTFKESASLIEDLNIYDVHLFKYSPRPGTKAFSMKSNLSGLQTADLLQKALKMKEKLREKYLSGSKTYQVLFEQKKGDLWQGLSEDYVRFFVKSNDDLKGLVENITFTSYQDQKTYGKIKNS